MVILNKDSKVVGYEDHFDSFPRNETTLPQNFVKPGEAADESTTDLSFALQRPSIGETILPPTEGIARKERSNAYLQRIGVSPTQMSHGFVGTPGMYCGISFDTVEIYVSTL